MEFNLPHSLSASVRARALSCSHAYDSPKQSHDAHSQRAETQLLGSICQVNFRCVPMQQYLHGIQNLQPRTRNMGGSF
jgi:hypothetical protein